jgi:hypothetical protein
VWRLAEGCDGLELSPAEYKHGVLWGGGTEGWEFGRRC